MTTYDNLNIATTTLIFDGNNNPSISAGTFDLSTLSFLPNVPLIDQIEVERIFDTGTDTKFGGYGFTIADRRQIFIFPKNWYTINEQTKVLTFVDLSTIPTFEDNGLYYPNSRTYIIESEEDLLIPTVQAGSTAGPPVREADKVYIRRKTPSINSIVTFAPGTRLTTTQLNLQFDQLKYIVQELVARFRNEAILKYDENAVDGPFLGQADFKMNNNFIKDMNSPALTQYGTQISDGNLSYYAQTFATNLLTLRNAIVNGTLHRTGIDTTPPTFTGDYTAGGLKLTNLANGVSATDAATISQISNASNLTTGTLAAALIANSSLSLGKLSNASGQGYVLPSDALPVANSLGSTTSFGASTGSNANNMLYASVDTKGRITSIGHRSLVTADLPTVGGVAGTYGDSTTVLTQVTVDSTGRITAASERALTATDIPAVNASAVTGALAASNLPSGVITTGLGVTSIPNSITVDTYGRVTSVSGGSITASNVSNFNTAVQANRLDQMTAPTAAVSLNNQKILLLGEPTLSTDAVTKNYVDTNYTLTSGLNTVIDNRLATNSVFLTGGVLSAGTKKISNVVDPTSAQDVVTRSYLEANALAISGGLINANSNPIINVTMRSGGSLAANDAVNYGYVQALTLYGQAVTDPQTFTNAWPTAGTIVNGNKPYEFSLATLAATTAEMLIVTDSEGRIYIPSTAVPAAAGRFFRLDTGVSPKKVIVYLDSAVTPSGSVFIRNFGTSRSVSASIAGAATLGLVQVPTAGGLLINSGTGDITLNTATASQLGGIKIGTGLSIASGIVSVTSVAGNSTLGQVMVAAVNTSGLNLDTGTGALSLPTASPTQLGGVKVNTSTGGLTNISGLIAVDLTDSTSSSSTTTVANSKAVNDLRGLTMLRDGTQAMTGKLTTATPSTNAGLNLPSGTTGSPVAGDVWNQSGTLKVRIDGSTTRDIAYTSSSITGNAATATALTPGATIAIAGAVTSAAQTFTGSSNLTFTTTLAAGQAVTAVTGAGANAITATRTGDSVALTLPQNIATNSAVQFGSATLGNITLATNTINTSTGGLILDSFGGTTTINDTTSIAGSLTVTGSNTTTLGGAVTLNDSLALGAAAAKVALGGTAAAATTSIERLGAAAGVSSIGDIILRTPASGKAYIVSNATNTTVTTANDAVITKGVLDTAISGISGFMPTNGAVSATPQTLGTSTANTFAIQTNNTDRLTIAGTGGTTIKNGLTVEANGVTITAGGLTTGTAGSTNGSSAIYGTLTVNGVISGVATPTVANHAATKGYVDTLKPTSTLVTAAITAQSQTINVNISSFTINTPTLLKVTLATGVDCRNSSVVITGTGTFLVTTGAFYGYGSSTTYTWDFDAANQSIPSAVAHSLIEAVALQTLGIAPATYSVGPFIGTAGSFTIAKLRNAGVATGTASRYAQLLITRLT
jgi:hypothetical protein